MIEDYLNQAAYRVVSSTKELLNAVPPSIPVTLTGAAPAVAFKCRCKVAASGTHTDLVGHLYINAEDLNFISGVTTKQSTTLLTSLPVVTYLGLDCSILVECLDSGGADIKAETLTAIAIRLEKYDSGYYNASGVWTKTDTQILSQTLLSIGDKVRYGGKDYTIRKVEDNTDLGGETEFYSYLAN